MHLSYIASLLRREAAIIERGHRHDPQQVDWDGEAAADREAAAELRQAAKELDERVQKGMG